jgi:hypothetical protein
MRGDVYYKGRTWNNKVAIYKRVKAGGDRHMADGMSEAFASKVVRLLNEDEARNENYVPPQPQPQELEPSQPPAEPTLDT